MRCHIDIVNFHLTSGIGAPQGMSIPRLEQLDVPRIQTVIHTVQPVEQDSGNHQKKLKKTMFMLREKFHSAKTVAETVVVSPISVSFLLVRAHRRAYSSRLPSI